MGLFSKELKMIRKYALLPLLALVVSALLVTDLSALPTGFTQKDLITGLDAVSSAVLPDGRILAIEKYGKVTLIKNGVKVATPFMDWSSKTNSRFEKGMMCILADPNFATNNYIYVWYTKASGNNGIDQVSRFTVTGDVVDGNSEKLMISLGDSGPQYHHGGGLAIGEDGKLYVASGCRGAINDGEPGPTNAQTKNRVEGKILRINIPEGDIPSDNPFYTTNTGDARAVYFWGLRQPFTLSYNSNTKAFWFSEVRGNSGDDRVNEFGPPGTNYGFGGTGTKNPLWTANSAGISGRAMIGSLWYTGTNFPAEYRDKYFFGGIDVTQLKMQDAAHSGAKNFSAFQCPIDVKQDAVGAIYVTTRCQTEDTRYGDGRVTKVWYGTEPTTDITPEKQSSIAAASRMNWSVLPGRILIDLEQAGLQTVELRSLDGKVLAVKNFNAKGPGELTFASARGTHLLVWKSGTSQAVTKVVL
ncbi:MAG: hypothetical protein JWO30_94 [Fibrobacteres bacterium]|nr:hypothetical protein [Fibrobacterota bacterium]